MLPLSPERNPACTTTSYSRPRNIVNSKFLKLFTGQNIQIFLAFDKGTLLL